MRWGVLVEPQFGHSFDEIRNIATCVDDLGVDSLWVSDHLMSRSGSPDDNCLEAWSVLAALTQLTERVRLGTLVTCQSYRNPALLAKIAASVDHMSGGRLEVGLGAGWKESEYLAYGYPFPAPPKRVTQLIETIEICRQMWTQSTTTWEGASYRVEDAQCAPRPERMPRLWIGGRQPRMMHVMASYAAAVNVNGKPTPEEYGQVMRALDDACALVGRDPRTILRSHMLVVRDLRRFKEQVAAYRKQGAMYMILVFPYGQELELIRRIVDKRMME